MKKAVEKTTDADQPGGDKGIVVSVKPEVQANVEVSLAPSITIMFWYVGAIVMIFAFGVIAATFGDTDHVIPVMTLCGVVISGLLAMLKGQAEVLKAQKETRVQAKETHDAVNSRMSELLALAKAASKAEGKEEARVATLAKSEDNK